MLRFFSGLTAALFLAVSLPAAAQSASGASGETLYRQAIALFQQGKQEESFNKLIAACDLDHAKSCLVLAQQYPKWGADFMDDAFFKASKACQLRLADGCLQAGDLLANGSFADGDFDASKAKHYYLEACKLGAERGCQLDTLDYVPE